MQFFLILGVFSLSFLNIFSSSGAHTPTTAPISACSQFPTITAFVQANTANQTGPICPSTNSAKLNLSLKRKYRYQNDPVPAPLMATAAAANARPAVSTIDPFEAPIQEVVTHKFDQLEIERNSMIEEYFARCQLLLNSNNPTNTSHSNYEQKDKRLQANYEIKRFIHDIPNIDSPNLTPEKIKKMLSLFESQLSPNTCQELRNRLEQLSPTTNTNRSPIAARTKLLS